MLIQHLDSNHDLWSGNVIVRTNTNQIDPPVVIDVTSIGSLTYLGIKVSERNGVGTPGVGGPPDVLGPPFREGGPKIDSPIFKKDPRL
jgi:hypothetical protein